MAADTTIEADTSKRLTYTGVAGVAISFICLICGVVYLIKFLNIANGSMGNIVGLKLHGSELQDAISGSLYVTSLGLLACAIFVGMAFGFLGFSLYLLGVTGAVGVDAQDPHKNRVKITGMSTGAFLMVCAMGLIGYCATHRPVYDNTNHEKYTTTETPLASPSPGTPSPPPGIDDPMWNALINSTGAK